MKDLKVLFSALFIFAVLFAQVGTAAEGDSNVTNLVASGDVTAGDDLIAGSTGDVQFRGTLLADGRAGGASTMSSSSTYLSAAGISYSVIQKRVGGGGGRDSEGIGSVLPDGKPGQELAIVITALQSGGSWKITPTRSNFFQNIVCDTVGDNAVLHYLDDTLGWNVKSQTGCTVTSHQRP